MCFSPEDPFKDIIDIMDITDIMDIRDIMDIMDIMDILIITAWMAMAGAVSALIFYIFNEHPLAFYIGLQKWGITSLKQKFVKKLSHTYETKCIQHLPEI